MAAASLLRLDRIANQFKFQARLSYDMGKVEKATVLHDRSRVLSTLIELRDIPI